MPGESICHFKGVGSVLSLFYFDETIPLANNIDSDQTPHHVASDQSLHYLPIILYGFPGKPKY